MGSITVSLQRLRDMLNLQVNNKIRSAVSLNA